MKESIKITKKSTFAIIWALLISGISISLSFNDSLWLDEALSLNWTRLPWAKMMARLIVDVHPPLFYIMLRSFSFASLGSIALGKAFVLLGYIITVFVGVFFLQKEFSTPSFIFYTLFTASIPMMLVKTVEIRMYSWAICFVVLTGIFMYKVMCDSKVMRYWIGFTLMALASAYTHYFALLVMVFLYPLLLVFFLINKDRDAMKKWLIMCVCTVIGYLPWLPVAISQVTNVNGGFWIEKQSLAGYIKELFRHDFFPHSNKIYCAIVLVLSIYMLVQYIRKKSSEYYWGIACSIPLAVILVFGYIYGVIIGPIMIGRYLLPALVLQIIGLSVACRDIKWWLTGTMCLFFVAMLCLNYREAYAREYDTHTDDTRTFFEENVDMGSHLYYNNGSLPSVIEYYYPGYDTCNYDELNDSTEMFDEFWIMDSADMVPGDMELFKDYDCSIYENMGFDNVNFTLYHMIKK